MTILKHNRSAWSNSAEQPMNTESLEGGCQCGAIRYRDSERLPWVRFADDLPRHAEFPPFE
jgi:hypothetical protein